MVKPTVVIGLALLGFAAYRFYSIPSENLPAGARIVAEEIQFDTSTPKGFVDSVLHNNKVVAFSKSYCGFSRRAKEILEKHLGPNGFHVVELDMREDGPQIQDHMQSRTGARTVPRVFIAGEFVGGADDLSALDNSGKLATLLKEKGITKRRTI